MAFRRLRLGLGWELDGGSADPAEAADEPIGANGEAAQAVAAILRNDLRFMGRLHLYTKERKGRNGKSWIEWAPII